MSHVQDRAHRRRTCTRCASASARRDLVLGCDLVVTASGEALSQDGRQARTRVAGQRHRLDDRRVRQEPGLAASRKPPGARSSSRPPARSNVEFVAAGKLATALMGDSIATNMFMLGYALQKGWVPLGAKRDLQRAIELNGVAVEFNQKAFLWGRRAAVDLERVERHRDAGRGGRARRRQFSRNLDELVARRVEFLTGYQDAAYAARYRRLVERVRAAEAGAGPGASSSPRRSRATTSSCWPTRTSTKSRACTPTRRSGRRSRGCSRATTS